VRLEHEDRLRMPPLGRSVVDQQAVALVRRWIDSLPGEPALPPPTITPADGAFSTTIAVHIAHPDALAQLYYTLDGSAPDQDSLLYQGPIALNHSATLRVKAYRTDHAPSLIVSGTFTIAPR